MSSPRPEPRVSRRAEWLAGLVLAGGGVLASLLLLEVAIRWLHLVPDRFWQPDPTLGARLVPGASGWWTQEEREFLVPVEVNSLGLHDHEHPYEKPAGVTRVLVLGDSFTEAIHVPLDSGFPMVLERNLNQGNGGQRYEVINAGVSGYGTASATLFFEQEGWRYQPDVVLLAFYPGNDIRNNSPTLEDAFRPVYADDGELERVQPTKIASAERGWLGRSAAYRFLRQLVLVRQPAIGRALVRIGWMKPEALRAPAQTDGIPVGFGMYQVPPDEVWLDAWQRTERLLDRLRSSVETRGARFAVALVTAREQVYPDTWQEILSNHQAMRQRQWDLEEPQRWLQRWCSQRGVACLDLANSFQRKATSGGRMLHYRHDGHWTDAGHELGGILIADFLRQTVLSTHN